MQGAEKVVIYGPGGIGKSSLWSLLPSVGINPLCLDIGSSSKKLDVSRIDDIGSFEELRAALHDKSLWKDFGAVVIDDLTKAEEMAADYVVRTIKHPKGYPIKSIEDYGWGDGYTYMYEAMLTLLGDLDSHIRAGRHVICICHERTCKAPNPSGDDWLRYEPALQSPASQKASTRHRVKEWADFLLFIGYDVAAKDGKASGAGTRAIYTSERPTHWAKSRADSQGKQLPNQIVYQHGDPALWKILFNK